MHPQLPCFSTPEAAGGVGVGVVGGQLHERKLAGNGATCEGRSQVLWYSSPLAWRLQLLYVSVVHRPAAAIVPAPCQQMAVRL